MSDQPKTEMVLWNFSEWVEVPIPPRDLPETDGEPLESNWHRLAMNLLIECLSYFWEDRQDFFVGGNMFVYFSEEQVRNKDYRGPDFFFVWGVDRAKPRLYWTVWDEGGKYPDVIIELLSPKTANEDRTVKKELYEKTFKTPEYFLYDPITNQLEGWRIGNNLLYEAVQPNEKGWLWSNQLQLWIGPWSGSYLKVPGVYPRFYEPHGNLVLTGKEAEAMHAEAERQRADAEKQRADAAEAEMAQLKAKLAELEDKDKPSS
jgi:Uma2 family endonuclease